MESFQPDSGGQGGTGGLRGRGTPIDRELITVKPNNQDPKKQIELVLFVPGLC